MLEDEFLHIVLWDYNLTGNTLLGHTAVAMPKALENLVFDATKQPTKRDYKAKFKNLYDDNSTDLKATVECKLAYLEVLAFKLSIKSGTRLPKVDMLGTCDGFIEARIVRGDPRKAAQFDYSPGESCLWSVKTNVVSNTMEPKWNQDFEAVVPVDNTVFLQLVLWDSNSPLPDVAIGHAVVELSQVASLKPGLAPTEHKLKLTKLPGVEPPGDFSKTRLKMLLGYSLVFNKQG